MAKTKKVGDYSTTIKMRKEISLSEILLNLFLICIMIVAIIAIFAVVSISCEREFAKSVELEIIDKEVTNGCLSMVVNVKVNEYSNEKYGLVFEYLEQKPTDDHTDVTWKVIGRCMYLFGELYKGNNGEKVSFDYKLNSSKCDVKEYRVNIYLMENGKSAGYILDTFGRTREFKYYPEKAIQTETFSVFM